MSKKYPNIPDVQFKDAVGFVGYCVGDDGSVWSCRKRKGIPRVRMPGIEGRLSKVGNIFVISDEWKQKFGKLDYKGYPRIAIYIPANDQHDRHGKQKHKRIHNLVLEAFVGPCPPGMEGCHENGNKLDNRLSNLRWDTPQSNIEDKERHGSIINGEKINTAKLNKYDVISIMNDWNNGVPIKEIAKKHPVKEKQIRNVVTGKSWNHITMIRKRG